MNAILNGSYLGHTDNHAIFINAPLNLVLQFLYTICGSIPWYPIILLLAIIIPLIIFIIKEQKNKQLWLPIAFLLPVMIPSICGLTFTTTAAMLAIIALESFMLHEDDFVFPSACMALCYCLREEMFIVGCAFLLVAIAYKLTERKWKQVLKTIGCTALISLLFISLNTLLYCNSTWQNYKEINSKRVNVYDYTWFIPYENAPELYEKYDISYEQYLLVDNYDMALESADWSEILSKVSQIQVDYYGDYSISAQFKRDAVLTLRVAFYRARHTYADFFWPYGALVLFLYLATLASIIISKKWIRLLPVGALLIGRNLIWMYLLLRGRFPDRVYISICGMECILLTTMAIHLFSVSKIKHERIKLIVNIVISLACAIVGIAQGATVVSTNVQHATDEQDYEKLYTFISQNPDSTYLLDVRTMLGDTGKIFDTGKTQDNYFQLGGWISESPLIYERIDQLIEKNNISEKLTKDRYDATDLLYYGEDIYFVVSEERGTEWMNKYLSSRYSDASLTIIDRIDGEKETFLICKTISE